MLALVVQVAEMVFAPKELSPVVEVCWGEGDPSGSAERSILPRLGRETSEKKS